MNYTPPAETIIVQLQPDAAQTVSQSLPSDTQSPPAISLVYDARGRVSAANRSDGSTVTFDYQDERLSSIANVNPHGMARRKNLLRDQQGRITQITAG